MKKKIFRSLILISLIVTLLSSVISTAFLHRYFNSEQAERLSTELSLAATAVNEMGTAYFESFPTDIYRFTVIHNDGTVIYDTKADTAVMENHYDREEIIEALKTGWGSSARYSSTLTEKTFYEALKLDTGDVLRISVNQITFGGAFLKILPMISVIAVITVIVALILSNNMAKRITAPLMELDLDNPAENDTYEELSPILIKIHRQHKLIKEQVDALSRKNEEFSQIISSMNEGLTLLNEAGCVIAMNKSAREIFNAVENPDGKDFLTIERTPEVSGALELAYKENHSESILEKKGRQYQLNISRIVADEKPAGTLILTFDITERVFAERNRQEFTANVSHELKTPLQTIIGSAELLENGLVKPEYTAKFVSNIKKEAARLVTLINDIIRLSQLDEKSEMIKETVDLYETATEAADVLMTSAENRNIAVNIIGEHVIINGIRRYIYEIIYNLCDNAIRYSNEGGTVNITVTAEKDNAVIIVADNGIGIPAEHQPRLFERFYRVDKSRSKSTGGTGLGLSIVKRAVMLHNGRIELTSRCNEGTTVKVILP